MPTVVEKYSKIFKLEAAQGYANRAVMGGLEALARRWPSEAREMGLPEDKIPPVLSLLRAYGSLGLPARRETLGQIRDLLSIPGLDDLPSAAEPAEPAPRDGAKTSPPTREPEPKIVRNRVNERMREVAQRPDEAHNPGLDAPVTVIRGVGDKQAAYLRKLGVNRIKDMLYLFPHRYDDYSRLKTINQLVYGEEVTVIASVMDVGKYPSRRGRNIIEAVVSDTTGTLRLLWFNNDWILRSLRQGLFISISGKVDTYQGRPVIWHPDYEPIDQQSLNTNRIVPVYPLTANITQRWLRRAQFNTVKYWAGKLEDFLPESILERANLPGLRDALYQIHFPDSQETLKTAQRRFAFDEIFLLQLGVIRQKRQWQELEGTSYTVSDGWLKKRAAALPYALTNAQKTAVREIRGDLAQPHPMNRLLQGDVGSGKTIVAVLGMDIVVEGGGQTALMAPTSILAEQHFRTISKLASEPNGDGLAWLKPGAVRLLTGDTRAAEREEIHAGLQDGTVKILIGTHALIEGPVTFQNLQMVVVDEQHRFGVAQRAALRSKGSNPHLLVMTATPIPRSLQLTIFGDLDVSVMDEMPAGRLPVETTIAYPGERGRVYQKIEDEVSAGHQAFIIYPYVEADGNEEIKAAVEEQERLQAEVFPHLRVGLVHGRLKPAEKDKVMVAFSRGKYDILVSTSVVEVGVDIPNATMMVIEGANRFGLAQLHQFRGRVGRGDAQSYCVLIPETDNAAENERLQVMTQTNDGFVLAEKDLQQRGPGDFLGTRQAGYVDLRMANLADIRLIKEARLLSEEILAEDPALEREEHRALRQAVANFWPSAEGSGDVS